MGCSNSLLSHLQYFLYFGSRRSSTCWACSAAAPCTCSITRPPHLLVLCRRILMQITRAICTMSHHFSRLCLCKEGYSSTTSYLIKTFSNLTVSRASDLTFFSANKRVAARFPPHFLIFLLLWVDLSWPRAPKSFHSNCTHWSFSDQCY